MEDYSTEELSNIKDTIVMIVEDDETLYDKICPFTEVMPLRFTYDLSYLSKEYIDKTKKLFSYYYSLDNFYNNEILRLKKHFKHFMRYPKFIYISKYNPNYDLIEKVCKDLEIELISNKEELISKVKSNIKGESMYTRKEEVYKYLDNLGIKYKKIEHEAVFTMEETLHLNLDNEEEIVKNLFIRDDKKQNYFLILVKGDKRVNLKEIRNNLNLRPLTFASEEDLEKYLGLKKGAVTILGILNDTEHKVKVLIDEDIKNFNEIGAHPNENTASVWLKLDDIEKILKLNNVSYSFIKI